MFPYVVYTFTQAFENLLRAPSADNQVRAAVLRSVLLLC